MSEPNAIYWLERKQAGTPPALRLHFFCVLLGFSVSFLTGVFSIYPLSGCRRMRLNIQGLIDNAKCYEMVRCLRWPEGVECPHCHATQIAKNGHDETQPQRQRHLCRMCNKSFDDLTGTVFAAPWHFAGTAAALHRIFLAVSYCRDDGRPFEKGLLALPSPLRKLAGRIGEICS